MCSCTSSDLYWSSTTYQGSLQHSWILDFNAGDIHENNKLISYRVRAVRAGS